MTERNWSEPSAVPNPNATLVELDREDGYVVGVDLGGTKVKAALAGLGGAVLAETTVPTDTAGGARLISQIFGLVQELCETAGVASEAVLATAIGGAGAPVNELGALAQAPNLGDVVDLNLASELSSRFGHPVIVENDANAAAFAELNHGRGRFYDDFVFIALGTGIGMGVVSNGQLVRGAHGAAGEIGFLPLGADPLDRGNQVRGPLEEVTAGERLAQAYRLSSGATGSVPEVFDRAARGDPLAVSLIDEEARHLALGIAAVVAVIDPALVILGGGVGSRRELLEPTSGWLTKYGHPDVIIEISEFGDRAGVVGAIDLAIVTARTRHGKE